MRPSFDHGRLDAAVDGDRLAVQHVLGTLQPMVVRYCRAHIGRAACGYRAADDVAQEILLAVLLALPRYRGTEARLFSFTIGIAKHKIADFYRERRRDRTVPFGNPPDLGDRLPPPEQLVLQAELGTQLSSLLDTLTPNQREIAEPAGDTCPARDRWTVHRGHCPRDVRHAGLGSGGPAPCAHRSPAPARAGRRRRPAATRTHSSTALAADALVRPPWSPRLRRPWTDEESEARLASCPRGET